MSNLVEFQESERSPVGLQASSGRGIPSLAASVDFHVGSIDAVNKQISDSFLVGRGSVVAPLVCEKRDCRGDRPSSRTRHVNKPHSGKKKRKRKHSNSAPVMSQRASPEKHSLIETAVYPGYLPDHPTLLPQGMDTVCQLQRVVEAQDDLKCKPSLRRFWTTQFLSQCSQAIFLDTFWWFFLHKFQADQTIQDCLFTRISNCYVEFLRDCAAIAVDTKCAGTFLRRYPDSICQAVYSAFICGYPASWKRFNDDFRTDLCNIVYMWQVGTKPLSQYWVHWNYSVLEPDNELKHMATSEDSTSPNCKSTGFNLEKLLEKEKSSSIPPEKTLGEHTGNCIVQQAINRPGSDHTNDSLSLVGSKMHSIVKQSSHILPQVLVKESDSKPSVVSVPVEYEDQAEVDATKVKLPTRLIPKSKGWAPKVSPKPAVTPKESHPMGQGTVFAHVVFDTYGHSPLVRHYLERRGLLQTAGYSILVKRTEVDKLPPIETPTYQDFLRESTKASTLTQANFDRNYSEQMQALNRFEHQLKKERTQHNTNMSNILSKPRVVRKLSNALLLQIMGEGRRVAQISSCIDETLEQLKSTL